MKEAILDRLRFSGTLNDVAFAFFPAHHFEEGILSLPIAANKFEHVRREDAPHRLPIQDGRAAAVEVSWQE